MGLFNLIGRISGRFGVQSPVPTTNNTHKSNARASGSSPQQQQQQQAPAFQGASEAAIKAATDLVASAVADLTEAAREMHTKGGLVAGAVSIGTTAYNSVAGNEEGPTAKDAGKTVTHDGRFPARDLVASAMEKYNEALQYVTDLPHIEGVEIKAPRSKKAQAVGGAAQLGMLAGGVGVGPIGMIVKKARQKKARKGVDQMLEDMQEVLDYLLQAKAPLMGAQYNQSQQQYNQQYAAPQQYPPQQYAAPQQYPAQGYPATQY